MPWFEVYHNCIAHILILESSITHEFNVILGLSIMFEYINVCTSHFISLNL